MACSLEDTAGVGAAVETLPSQGGREEQAAKVVPRDPGMSTVACVCLYSHAHTNWLRALPALAGALKVAPHNCL